MTSWKPWFACIHSTVSERRSSPGSRARSARVSREKRRSASSSSSRSSSVIRSAATRGDEALELGAQQERLPHLRARERPDAEAAVRLERDEPERGEPAQRLAHRRPADLVLRRDLLLAEDRARARAPPRRSPPRARARSRRPWCRRPRRQCRTAASERGSGVRWPEAVAIAAAGLRRRDDQHRRRQRHAADVPGAARIRLRAGAGERVEHDRARAGRPLGDARLPRGARGPAAARSIVLGAATFAGAIVGATLLLTLPASAFKAIVPFFIASALVLVVAQPWLSARLEARRGHGVHGAPVDARRPSSRSASTAATSARRRGSCCSAVLGARASPSRSSGSTR